MKKNLVYKAFVKGYWVLNWWYHELKRRSENKKERLLFTFGGRSEGWPGLGRSFYNAYPDFAASIHHYNKILIENGGSEILSYFEEPVNEHYFNDESKFTCITAIQIATVKHYHYKGILPNAVMGVSMGEVVAAYTAGALTADEALKVAISYMSIYKADKMEYYFLFLNTGFKNAQDVCKASPVRLEIIYEDNTGAVLATCHQDDIDALKQVLTARGLSFKILSDKKHIPYHTSLMKKHNKLLKGFYKDFEPRPLKCDYYSPTLGRLIPKYEIIEPEYWYRLACKPVLFSTAMQAVINDGYHIFLQVGPPAISDRQLSSITQSLKINVMHTYQNNTDELAHYKYVMKQIRNIDFENTLIGDRNETNLLNGFKQKFNINSTFTAPAYEYLRSKGPIHFLPEHNSWIILNYDDVEQVLKQPELFSSSILEEFDPILLGANPEQHQIIRGLLHPLFSPAVISEMAAFTTITAEAILEELCQQNSFDFVKDYSDPLSLLVLCNFFGLSAHDANSMLVYTGKDYHNTLYWQRIEEYFNNEFLRCQLTKQDCLWGKLRELVQSAQFTFEDAVSLLRIIWTAGMATTSALISTAIYTTLSNHEIAEEVNADERLVAKFIEECLRLQTPLSAIYRITTQPVLLAGQQLPVNTTVLLHLKSAMTDPKYYTNPNEFLVTRPAKRHLAFGAGIHQCIGMGIARAEANSALKVVFKKLPTLKMYNLSVPQYSRVSELQPITSLIITK